MSSLDSTGYSSWWLERDEEDLYLVCNGKRGRSRRSDQEFGNIVSVSQHDDKFKFTFADGRKTVVSTHAVSVQAMSQNFGSEENLDDVIDYIASLGNSLSQHSQGKRAHEEPQPRDAPAKKKHAVSAQPGEEDIDDIIHRKCAGIMEVPLSKLLCRKWKLAHQPSSTDIGKAKGFLEKSLGYISSAYIIPVQKVSSGAGSSVYHVLGGSSLVMAAKEMADDDRTIRNTAWRVRVYQDLSEVEAVRVRYLHTANQNLEAGPSL